MLHVIPRRVMQFVVKMAKLLLLLFITSIIIISINNIINISINNIIMSDESVWIEKIRHCGLGYLIEKGLDIYVSASSYLAQMELLLVDWKSNLPNEDQAGWMGLL
jgi:hypothetical protein